MKSRALSKLFHGAVGALVLSAIFPVAALGQRRWMGRPHRSRIVVYNYQPRPYAIYQRRPYYSNGYSRNYYGGDYGTYGTSQPYYNNRYYSYRYSQPYFANRSTYAWTNPSYRYDESWNRRHRRNGLRGGIRLR